MKTRALLSSMCPHAPGDARGCLRAPMPGAQPRKTHHCPHPQEHPADGPGRCASVSGTLLNALSAMLSNGSAWPEGATFCSSTAMQLTTVVPGPQASDCLSLPAVVGGVPQMGLAGLTALASVACMMQASASCTRPRVTARQQRQRAALAHSPPCVQYHVTSPVSLFDTPTSAHLVNATPAVIAVPCPLPSFGINSSATLAVTRTWNWCGAGPCGGVPSRALHPCSARAAVALAHCCLVIS